MEFRFADGEVWFVLCERKKRQNFYALQKLSQPSKRTRAADDARDGNKANEEMKFHSDGDAEAFE